MSDNIKQSDKFPERNQSRLVMKSCKILEAVLIATYLTLGTYSYCALKSSDSENSGSYTCRISEANI